MTRKVGYRADALWRSLVYAAVVQIHLVDNVLMARPLVTSDVKARPSGHWGTVSGTAWALSHVVLAAGRSTKSPKLVPMLGAGHAGVVQISLAWLTKDLYAYRSVYTVDESGLRELARSFPEVNGLGAEVSPLLPSGGFMGGCIGGALAFACGAALDAPERVVVPIIGDGECETPTTAASWLATRGLPGGYVLPIVHLNGFRMGGASLLGEMTDNEVCAYFAGQGWQARMFHVRHADPDEHDAFHKVFRAALDATIRSERVAIILRCVKGWSGPAELGGLRLLGTPNLHKTPLTAPATDPEQLERLGDWLNSYRPQELFDSFGHPEAGLAESLAVARIDSWDAGTPSRSVDLRPVRQPDAHKSFGSAAWTVLQAHAQLGGFRVFSPDELHSNRLGELTHEAWVTELLAEEVLLGWLAGWTASGRRGVLVSYEAFAPLLMAGLVAHLKQRRLRAIQAPSLNLLLTSYGWHNVYTHGDPSLTTATLGMADPAVRVLTPADPARIAATLNQMLGSTGQLNILIAGKNLTVAHPEETIAAELSRGLAIWHHVSDEGEPDLTVLCAGDLPASVTCAAVPGIRKSYFRRVRIVNVNDLTVFGEPDIWPRGLTSAELFRYLGEHAAVLIVTLGHPAAVWGLLAGRLHGRPVEIIGWREPPGPMPQAAVAASAGLDVQGLLQAARRLARQRGVP